METTGNQFTKKAGYPGSLFKAYFGDSEKYSGAIKDNFERKFVLFLEPCSQSDVSDEDCAQAFSIMLAGAARLFYLDVLRPKFWSLSDLAQSLKEQFHMSERRCALVRKWNALSLRALMSTKIDKNPSECLEILLEKKADIQSSLPNDSCSDKILGDKLLKPVRDVDDCRLPYHKPADTVKGVISDLHASLATCKRAETITPNKNNGLDINYIDRKYRSQRLDDRLGDCNCRNKKCIVCNQTRCWSTNHPTRERIDTFQNNQSICQFLASLDDDEQDTGGDHR